MIDNTRELTVEEYWELDQRWDKLLDSIPTPEWHFLPRQREDRLHKGKAKYRPIWIKWYEWLDSKGIVSVTGGYRIRSDTPSDV